MNNRAYDLIGDFARLPNEVLSTEVAKRLVDYNLESTIRLARMGPAFYFLFKRALATKLLQLLTDISYLPCRHLEQKKEEILDLVFTLPQLMFIEVKGTTPLNYLFSGLDLALQYTFRYVAEKSNNLACYDQQVTVRQWYYDPDELYCEFNDFYHKFLKLEKPSVESWSVAELSQIREEMKSFLNTNIAAAQYYSLTVILEDAINFHLGEELVLEPPESHVVKVVNSSDVMDLSNPDSAKKLRNCHLFFNKDRVLLADDSVSINASEALHQREVWRDFVKKRMDKKQELVNESVARRASLNANI